MSSANTGWIFYKDMYRYLYIDETRPQTICEHKEHLQYCNNEILKTKCLAYHYLKFEYNFQLKTIYPGLVIGAGYSHNAIKCDENFDFGFYFDHTTGMPIIPGSSVKGVLRSILKRLKDEDQQEILVIFFKDIFRVCRINLLSDMDTKEAVIKLQQIENCIFEGVDTEGKSISMYERDKFFDAVIIGGDEDELIFTDDFITPHQPNLLREPTPNRMLKVRPDVTFEFSFELYDTKLDADSILTAAQKRLLFLELLQFSGIGAKTNVGYGQFAIAHKKPEPVGNTDIISMIINENDPIAIKNMLSETDLPDDVKEKICKEINVKIIKANMLDDHWFEEYGKDIMSWWNHQDNSNGKKRKKIGYEYFNILKIILE